MGEALSSISSMTKELDTSNGTKIKGLFSQHLEGGVKIGSSMRSCLTCQ